MRCSRSPRRASVGTPHRCYHRGVGASVRRLFAAILLSVCVGAPIVEMFDRWDDTLHDGNDTEANLVIVVLCVGVGLVSAGGWLPRVRPTLTSSRLLPVLRPSAYATEGSFDLSIPNSSSPTPLRV